jgi:hypothetical protein
MEEPTPLAERLRSIKAHGFRAFKIGWGPFGQRNNTLDEAIVRAARGGWAGLTDGDAGGSDAFWPLELPMGAAHFRDACRLRCRVV